MISEAAIGAIAAKAHYVRIAADHYYTAQCLLRCCESCHLSMTALGNTIGING